MGNAFSTERKLNVSKTPNHKKKMKNAQMLRSLNVLILDDRGPPGCFSSISIAVPKATAIDHRGLLVMQKPFGTNLFPSPN